MSEYYMNEAADARRDAANDKRKGDPGVKKPRIENEMLEVSGKVISEPETRENAKGRKSCTFEVLREDGLVVKIYTVRFYGEASKLSVGDEITVRYIHDGKFNNQVGSIVYNGEGNEMRNMASTIRRIEGKVDSILDLHMKTASRVSAIQQKLDYLASEAEMYSNEGNA